MTLIKGPELPWTSRRPLISPEQIETTQNGLNTVLLAGISTFGTPRLEATQSSAGTARDAQAAPQALLISDPPPSPSATLAESDLGVHCAVTEGVATVARWTGSPRACAGVSREVWTGENPGMMGTGPRTGIG